LIALENRTPVFACHHGEIHMATRKAQNAPANAPGPNAAAADKSTGPIKVVMPDQNGDFSTGIPKGAVDKVQVVDVDMVLQLKDGTSLVLAGGAISAMDASHTAIRFADGPQDLSRLLDQVGLISVPKLDTVLSSLQATPSEGNTGTAVASAEASTGLAASITSQIVNQLTQIVQTNAQSATIQTMDPNAQIAVLSQNTNTSKIDSQPLQHQEQPSVQERPGVIPVEHVVGPNAPAMALSLVNLTTTTQIGNVFYGSGGTAASAVDASNATQYASQVLNTPNSATEIHAISNIPANDFIKVVNIAITGDGLTQSVTIKNVPAGMSIANGTDLGGGNWSIAVTSADRSVNVQLEYSTVLADPLNPIHGGLFSLEFDVSLTTTAGVTTLSQVKQFVIKDVLSANDLTYIDSTTGQAVYVLPAQGNSHIIHAGDGGVTIYGSNAADFLYGGAGSDTIIGGSGNTYFEGGAGADHLQGSATGVNTAGYSLSATGVTVNLSTGTGSGGDAQGDVLTNIRNFIGSAFNDTIVASSAANNINGGTGGSDTVSYAGSTAGVTVNLITGLGTGGDAQGDVLAHIQNVIGSTHNDTFIASAAANAFTGGGRDVIGFGDIVSYASDVSGAGVIVDLSTGTRTGGAALGDTYTNINGIIGTAFNDTFIDGAGINRYDGGAGGQDTVSYADSTAGVNVNFVTGRGTGGYAEGDSYVNVQNVIGSTHNDVFTAGSDSKSFTGGGADAGGFDTVSFAASGAAVTVNTILNTGSDASGNSYTFSGIEKFIGSNYNDTFIASAAANIFDGGSGSDTVNYAQSNAAVIVDLNSTVGAGTSGGYAQGDVLIHVFNIVGSNYDDTFVASNDANAFEGGAGSNTVSYAQSTFGVIVDLSNTTGPGTSGGYALGDTFSHIQNLIGSQYDDVFIASADANRFDGGTGGLPDGGVNTVSYSQSTTAVTVDLSNTTGAGTSGGAAGDSFIRIQNLVGSAFDDTFVASNVANVFDGGSAGSDTVSYAQSDAAVIVDLSNATGAGTSGGFAAGDKFISIENAVGSNFDDTFFASSAANKFTGGTGSDTVSYARAVDGNGVTVDLFNNTGTGGIATGDTYNSIENATGTQYNDTFIDGVGTAPNVYIGGGGSDTVSYAHSGAAVTVNFVTGQGSGAGSAAGDTYSGIQNVIGGAFDDTLVAAAINGRYDGGASVTGSHNRIDFSSVTTTNGVTVDLVANTAATSANSYTLASIQDITGTAQDDTFVASIDANKFDGGTSTASSHNRVSYANSTTAVTVDLVLGTATGGYAVGDTFTNIQDLTGSGLDDTFIANAAANKFDGGAGSDTVSYAKANDGAGVTVDLFSGQGTTGFAAGDTYTNIENVVGSDYNDTFYANALVNKFTGGLGSNTVDYSHAADGNGVTINLFNNTGAGGIAQGDTYVGIQNATGTQYNDIFVDGSGAAPDAYVGGAGSDTIDYSNSTAAVTVNFVTNAGSGTGGSFAIGDTYNGIENVLGSAFDDTFVVAAVNGKYDGGASVTGSHNKLDFSSITTTNGVLVDLVANTAATSANSYTLANIQDITGTAQDDTFVASIDANKFDGGASTATSHNRVSYAQSATAVTVDLTVTDGSGTGGGAAGDTFANIQDLTGSALNDTFVASTANNNFDGGAGSDTVSYAKAASGVTVDLSNTTGSGSAGAAAGDTFTSIENVIGSNFDDIFIDGSIATSTGSTYTGGLGSNTISYARANDGVGVTVNLATGLGSNGFATNDVYSGVQNIIGSQYNDTFYANNTASSFDGGDSTTNKHNRVDFSQTNNTAVTVDLTNTAGTGSSGGAAGDKFANIQDLTGTTSDDTFIASADANFLDGGLGTLHNRVSYAQSTAAVTVDLNQTNGTGTSGGYAQGDHLVNIQDITGSSADDTFIASTASNNFDGGTSTVTSHNLVSYAQSATAVTVDLTVTDGTGTSGGAAGDTFVNIQDLTGSGLDDTFIASAAGNRFDGGAGSDTVSYAKANDGVGVSVDLFTGLGANGFAANDTYANIENVIGTAYNDTFFANALVNKFTGGLGSNTVDYSHAGDGNGVTVNLFSNTGTGGIAQGDTYVSIQNVTGTQYNDTFVDGSGVAPDAYVGGAGSDTVDYSNSTAAVTVNFVTGAGSGLGSSFAIGDTYNGIENVLGSAFDDTFVVAAVNGKYDGGASVPGSHNKLDFSSITTTTGVTVDLVANTAATSANNYTLAGIQDVKGTAQDDTFVASSDVNNFDGGASTAASHNRVSYTNSVAAVTVDLVLGTGVGGYAQGDVLTNIQDVTGGAGDDIFIASNVSNKFDGGAGSDTVSYAKASDNNGVTVDLFTGLGANGFAAGDTYTGIENVIGTDYNDTFFATATANVFTGGLGSNTVNYSHANDSTGVTVDLFNNTGTAGFATGDTYSGIQNVTGTTYNDTFIDSTGAAANAYAGGGGSDTVSYAHSAAGVIVNLQTGLGSGTGSSAVGDTYSAIQNVIGSSSDDQFIAGAAIAVSRFDGGAYTAASHNSVSFASIASAVTINLVANSGSSSANTYTFAGIQDVIGTAFDDKFFASSAANDFDGGGTSVHNRVSYELSTTTVTVDLFNNAGSNNDAAGDIYIRIQDATGGSADDTFVASADANNFDGGAGSDTVDYSHSNAAVTIDLKSGAAGVGGFAAGDVLTSIENVVGSTFNDTFVGSTTANAFTGGGGIDTVIYATSATGVTVNLSSGAAGIGGDAAGDTYSGITNVIGSSSVDHLTGATGGNSTLTGGANGDVLVGIGTNNTASYTASGAITIDLFNGTGVGNDAQGDTLSNIQNIIGGTGNDLYYANADANKLDGNTGNNTVSYERQNGVITGGVTVDLTTGLGSGANSFALGDSYVNIQNIYGTQYNDTLKGLTAGGSILMGGAGADILIGSGATSNTATYVNSTAVRIDLVHGTGLGGEAEGDTLSGIQNLIGGAGDDYFILNPGVVNVINGMGGSNTVSYEFEANNVTVNLSAATGVASGNGTFGLNDTFTSIQNAVGGAGNDTFIAGVDANAFDGGAGTDTVSYASYVVAAAATGVTVDLHLVGGLGHGSVGWAANDTYLHIENVVGTIGSDTFVDAGDGVVNNYNGGANGAGSVDTVSYQYVDATSALTISLSQTAHANAGSAAGDTYTNIENLTGSALANTSIWGDAVSNVLTAIGTTNTNYLNGGGAGTGGTDILDGRLGGHNTLVAGDGGLTIIDVNASGNTLAANVSSVVGSTLGGTTLKIFNLGAELDASSLSAGSKVTHLGTLDMKDGVATHMTISAQDVITLGNSNQLTVRLDLTDSISLAIQPGETTALFGNGDYAFYNSSGVEIARLHQQTA
jgi:hypothetical protein